MFPAPFASLSNVVRTNRRSVLEATVQAEAQALRPERFFFSGEAEHRPFFTHQSAGDLRCVDRRVDAVRREQHVRPVDHRIAYRQLELAC